MDRVAIRVFSFSISPMVIAASHQGLVSVSHDHAGWAAKDDCAHPMVGNDHESPNVGVCPTQR
jgi:hypothetical protein